MTTRQPAEHVITAAETAREEPDAVAAERYRGGQAHATEVVLGDEDTLAPQATADKATAEKVAAGKAPSAGLGARQAGGKYLPRASTQQSFGLRSTWGRSSPGSPAGCP